MDPSIECKCEIGRFTCGHCLQTPTLEDFNYQPSEAQREKLRAYLRSCQEEVFEAES